MLIEHYDLEVTTPPCEPGAERFNAIARFTVDISEVLPYLNATWKGAIYDHENHFLTWRGSGRTITVWPHEIAVSNLEDREEATQVVEQLVERINSTWERRTEIEPWTSTSCCLAPTAKPVANPPVSSSPANWPSKK